MTLKPGCNYISYVNLAQTADGLKRWNDYMRQVTEIGLKRSKYFFPETARDIIPEDAKLHRFYGYFNDRYIIDAFCVAVISCRQAELLWVGCRPRHRKSMEELYDFFEKDLFEGDCQVYRIMGMSCTEDTRIANEDGKEILGCNWLESHRFHESRGYRFTHRLDDFWGEGSHAFVFMKLREQYLAPREAHRYGYSKRDGYIFKPVPPKRLEDQNLDLNKRLYKQVWHFLDIFDDTFVKSFPPEEKKSFISDDKRIKGFTGLILSDCVNRVATIFATFSAKPDEDAEPVLKFEYDIDSSAITQMLLSDEIHDNEGILHYEADWDRASEISVKTSCERHFPTLLNDSVQYKRGFTVFYVRRPGLNGNMSILYILTPCIENVVWYRPLWKAFARYSFALDLLIYSYFRSMVVTNPNLRKNDYFKTLIEAMYPSPFTGPDDSPTKIAKMMDEIRKRTDAHIWARVRSKESAIVHLGHSLGTTLGEIAKYFQKREDKTKDVAEQMAENATFFLKDHLTLLQASIFDSLQELLNNDKVNKFLLNTNDSASRKEIKVILERCRMLASGVRYLDHDGILDDYFIEVQLEFLCRTPITIRTFKENNQYWLVRQCMITSIVTELFRNIAKHGHITKEEGRQGKYRKLIKIVEVSGDTIEIDNESIPVLIFRNYIDSPPLQRGLLKDEVIAGKSSNGYLARTDIWKKWPENIVHSGPGLAIDTIRGVEIGDLFYRILPVTQGGGFWFETALWIRGISMGDFNE